MIYDKVLTIYKLGSGDSPLNRKLTDGVQYYYAEKEVYGSRYFQSQQVGVKISMMVEFPRFEGEPRITAENYCVPEDGETYKIVQAQYGADPNGLPITTLSLEKSEKKYEILRP